MIIREFLEKPVGEISRFDFFNDYQNTRTWLLDAKAPADVVNLLDAACAVWVRLHHEQMVPKKHPQTSEKPEGQ